MMNSLNSSYTTIKVSAQRGALTLQLYRPEANNSINTTLIKEIMSALMEAENDTGIKVVVLEGLPDNFCTGMDFKAVSDGGLAAFVSNDPKGYYDMLKHLSLCSKIIIAKVEGKVNAGGIGLIAASDIVIATETATFGLSEALFGLLPAMVMPFLIRRIGYQKAQWLTLTTQSITASRAQQIGLVDELSDSIQETLRKSLLRLTRLEASTIRELKDYMSKLWIINDHTEQLALQKITSLIGSEKVQFNIKNFVQNGKLPWDK